MTNYQYRNLTLAVGGVSNGTTESIGPDLGRQILIHSISAQMYATTIGDYFRIISYGRVGSENEIISLRAYVANQLLTWNAPCHIWLEPDQRFYMQRDLQAVGSGLNVSVLYSVEATSGPDGVTPNTVSMEETPKKSATTIWDFFGIKL